MSTGRLVWSFFIGSILLLIICGCNSDVQPIPTPTPTDQIVIDLTPCATEDSVGPCYWDGETMGNGRGSSFSVDADNNVYYLD